MHELFFAYIENKSGLLLPEKDRKLLQNTFTHKKFKKRQYFLEAGRVCNQSAFITKGAMRHYTMDDNGNEHMVELMLENWWACDVESMESGNPSAYYIDAWEDTNVLLISKENLSVVRSIQAITRMEEVIIRQRLAALQKRINETISFSAVQRYEKLVRTYPEFQERFPQRIIASYLGISKDTLSRIRQTVSKK